MKTKRRVRVTSFDIAKAREELLSRPKVRSTKPTELRYVRDKWHGLIYCDSYGWSWLTDRSLEMVCLGRTDEILLALQENRVDVNNSIGLFISLKGIQTEKKNHMCHSDTETSATLVNDHVQKSVCATFLTNRKFLKLLDDLIAEDYGILTIQSQLKSKGYEVPYRTLGRWVKERQVKHDYRRSH